MLQTPETQARMYGGTIACYMWSIYLCDFYRLDLWMSVVCIVSGACFLWYLYPSSPQQSWTHKNEKPSIQRSPQQGRDTCQGQQHQEQPQHQHQQHRPSAFFNQQPMSSISAAVVPASASESSSTPLSVPITFSVLAQECNASEVHLLDQDDVVLHLSVHLEKNHVDSNRIPSCSVDSQHDNTTERNEILQRSQYAWLVFATHSLIVLAYLSVVGTDLLADWIGSTLAARGLMILGVLSCNGLLARWVIGLLGPLDSREQQKYVKDGRLEVAKATMACHMEADPQSKIAEKQHQLLSINGPCQQFLHQQPTKDRQEIVKHHYTTYRPAVALDLEPSSLSTVDYIRQEMRVWALSLYFLVPEAVPRPVLSLYERAGDELGLCKGYGYDRDDNEPLMNDSNNDRYDDTPTMSNHGNYERRERDVNTKSAESGRVVRKRPKAQLPTLGPQNLGAASDSAPHPIESTLVRLARLTMDSERLSNIFNYYRRQHTASTSLTSRSGSRSGCAGISSGDDQLEQTPDIAFVVRSNTLPMVRVGLYGTSEKRLWTSTGSILVTASPITTNTPSFEEEESEEDMVIVNHVEDD